MFYPGTVATYQSLRTRPPVGVEGRHKMAGTGAPLLVHSEARLWAGLSCRYLNLRPLRSAVTLGIPYLTLALALPNLKVR